MIMPDQRTQFTLRHKLPFANSLLPNPGYGTHLRESLGLQRDHTCPGHCFPLVEVEKEGGRDQICPKFLLPPPGPLIDSLHSVQKYGPNASTQHLSFCLYLCREAKRLDEHSTVFQEALLMIAASGVKNKCSSLIIAKSC